MGSNPTINIPRSPSSYPLIPFCSDHLPSRFHFRGRVRFRLLSDWPNSLRSYRRHFTRKLRGLFLSLGANHPFGLFHLTHCHRQLVCNTTHQKQKPKTNKLKTTIRTKLVDGDKRKCFRITQVNKVVNFYSMTYGRYTFSHVIHYYCRSLPVSVDL